ncbi:SseB family protein [Fastidiosipila sanguinis]|uniref:SseB protein N-terminal domain-containing protein n=1 Tax=Fastidiosipila sanguinis TaxID=236753 RepID=A0A2S0KLN2_9FIRM|nr:SseB family protein [Fastidiosipila sanguinis]AVM41931.1 hypothetical protein C5Q98_01175 [Fastidiosipila sanguinis]
MKDTNTEDKSNEKDKVLDDYMAKLWSYDPENPELGMRDPKELEEIFTKADFDFNPLAYQAGELRYLAYHGGRLVYFMRLDKAQKRKEREKIEAEGGKTELSEEQKEADEQSTNLLLVTQNRLDIIHEGLRDRIIKLLGVYYYKSKITNAPYIDGKGRVFIFITPVAIEKAETVLNENPDLELEFADNIENLSKQLYLNACDIILINDGDLAFEARREYILPQSEIETDEEKNVISENNRNLRYFILSFGQVLMSEHEFAEEDDEQYRMALLQLEAQISARLMSANAYFTVKEIAEGNQAVEFVILNDETGRKAIGCFVDDASLPVGGPFEYKVMPFLPIAKLVLESLEEGAQQELDGIIINPGTLNFFLDIKWLQRLLSFADYMQKQQENKEKRDSEEK